MKKIIFAFLCIFLLGAGLRALYVWRGVDRASWREADMAAIARNFYREGMNPFYPRVDWRGDGPGYAEMELPLLPWTMAVLYKMFGVHEVFGRVINYLFALAAMFVFIKLARYLLPPAGALIAALFFALSPIVIGISNSLQPESGMFFFYILAVYAFLRWLDTNSQKHFVIAIVATAMTILAKASAAHLGIFFAILILQRQGWGVLRNWRAWVFGAGALLPAMIWYRHAHHLYLTYGNSLGVSNETHWAGLDLFTDPSFIRGILRNELEYVWMPAGAVLVAIGLLLRRSGRVVWFGLCWLAAVFVFYLIAARTTGDSWAFYYHVVAVPAVALLIGHAIKSARRLAFQPNWVRLGAIGLGVISIIASVAIAVGAAGHRRPLAMNLLALLVLTGLVAMFLFGSEPTTHAKTAGKRWPVFCSLAVMAMSAVLVATFLYEVRESRQDLTVRGDPDLRYSAEEFAPAAPPGTLILASGGPCVDPTGYPVAFNSSYMFYWMDRKGFNICEQKQSVPAVEAFAARGAKYFVAEQTELDRQPGFEAELRHKYPVVKESSVAIMFALRP